jgi:hypothetical protein
MSENQNAASMQRIRTALKKIRDGQRKMPSLVVEIDYGPSQELDSSLAIIKLKRSETDIDFMYVCLYPSLEDRQNPDYLALIELIIC